MKSSLLLILFSSMAAAGALTGGHALADRAYSECTTNLPVIDMNGLIPLSGLITNWNKPEPAPPSLSVAWAQPSNVGSIQFSGSVPVLTSNPVAASSTHMTVAVATPEPATISMVILGVGLIAGITLRRGKQSA